MYITDRDIKYIFAIQMMYPIRSFFSSILTLRLLFHFQLLQHLLSVNPMVTEIERWYCPTLHHTIQFCQMMEIDSKAPLFHQQKES